MKQEQLRILAQEQLPKYLRKSYTLGKSLRRNNLKQGQKVVAIANSPESFFFVAEILGFVSFQDLNREVCLAEKLIPNTPENSDFYNDIDNPVFSDREDDEAIDPVFFHRSKGEPASDFYFEESVRSYDAEMSPTGLSDEGFSSFVYCEPIMIAQSLRKLQKKYIMLQRHIEFRNWMSPSFTPISWFELIPISKDTRSV